MVIEAHIFLAKAQGTRRVGYGESSGTTPSRVTNIPGSTNFAGERSSSVASKTNQRQKSEDTTKLGNTDSLFPHFNSKSKNNGTYLDVIRFILATEIPKGYEGSSELLSSDKGDFFESLTEVGYENGKPKGIELKQNQRIGFNHLSKTKQEEIKQGKDNEFLQAMFAFSEILFTSTSQLLEIFNDNDTPKAESLHLATQINKKNPKIIECFVKKLEQDASFRERVSQWVNPTQTSERNELPSTL